MDFPKRGSDEVCVSMIELRNRLAGGVLGTAHANRPDTGEKSDCSEFDYYLLAGRLPERLAELMPNCEGKIAKISQLLEELGNTPPPEPDVVAALIRALSALFSHRRPLLLGVLFSPHLLLDRLPKIAGEDTDVQRRWAALCWIAEAAWDCVQNQMRGPDQRMLMPLAARLRFLVLSEPMRHRAEAGSPWMKSSNSSKRCSYEWYRAVFGERTWHELIGRCREARWNWQAQLDAYQSAPLLAQAKPSEIEEELGLLVFRTGRAGPPLVLSPKPLGESARVGADDQAVITEAVERHFLPRFQLGRVMALVTASPSPAWRSALWAALPLVPLVAAFALAAAGRFTVAAQAALGCYALIGLGALLGGARVAAPWLLRIPAASALGLLVLIALHPTWWNSPKGGWGTPAALLTLSFGYLVVEARNHGVEAVRAVLRAAVVTVIGVLHAVLVALIGLLLIAPAYAERPDNGPRIADWFASGDTGRSWYLLLLAAAWCLVAGVFSQILWEDRPITASLAHVGWRSGR